MSIPRFCLLALISAGLAQAAISGSTFRHHFIANNMPGKNIGMGASVLVDLDRDGDLDFAVVNRGDNTFYWFEQKTKNEWIRHIVGELPTAQLGGVSLDVDSDGWPDLIVGGYWFRNPGKPREQPFARFSFDNSIHSEIHDIVAADIDKDGRPDLVATGDEEGCFWYSIPKDPVHDANWPKVTVTTDVLNERVDIHSGFYPGGVGDLDGDGDADIFLADRWMENRSNGKQWIPHRVPFGRRGPWGFSARSVITDIDGDGDNDIIVTDSDGQNSGVAWLENNDKTPPSFSPHYLANKAPGTRGSFHSLQVADFDGDGDLDILVVEQEDPSIPPTGATPRWFLFENVSQGRAVRFEERVILDERLGGHDAWVGDIDGDGDLDIIAKIWSVWRDNNNNGQVHIDWLKNTLK